VTDAKIIYGELQEGLHIAGYAFERSMHRLRTLLSGGGWKECGFAEVKDFLNSLQLDEFRRNAEERKQIAKLIKELQPETSNRQIADAMGVSDVQIGRDLRHNVANQSENSNETNAGAQHDVAPTSGASSARSALMKDERKEQRAERAATAASAGATATPDGKYRILYSDPPWSYGNTQPEYHTEQRDHYPVMPLEDICTLPVKDWADDNAVLFLWVTSPILEDAFKVIAAWGFEYKSSFVWDKIKHNMGHYNSVRHELLLICTRGSCQPDHQQLFDSVQTIERGKHSVKPLEFYVIIETLYTHGRRLEIFARQSRDGWDQYGHKAEIVA
jgi:N6-adenosine-specific RNA methylase IME4